MLDAAIIPNILLPQRLPRPILALQQHRSGLQGFQAVPLADGDIKDVASRNHLNRRGLGPGIVVEEFPEVPPQADHRFGGVPVPMDGHHGSRLDGVQHALGKILRAVPEVQVHPEARRRLGLRG